MTIIQNYKKILFSQYKPIGFMIHSIYSHLKKRKNHLIIFLMKKQHKNIIPKNYSSMLFDQKFHILSIVFF